MRELKINGVSLNADYWGTKTYEEFVSDPALFQYWPDLDENQKRELLIRVWPYLKAHESCGDATTISPAGPADSDGRGGTDHG